MERYIERYSLMRYGSQARARLGTGQLFGPLLRVQHQRSGSGIAAAVLDTGVDTASLDTAVVMETSVETLPLETAVSLLTSVLTAGLITSPTASHQGGECSSGRSWRPQLAQYVA